jgi:hypothetical protein
MDIENLERIISHYSKDKDFDKIAFKWNGKFGQEFRDANYDFRIQLCEFIYPQIDRVDLELIRDLYIEFAKSSEASFGAYMKLNLLGQELLIRGGTRYLMDYLKGASYTADTYAATSGINISKELAKEILFYIEEKIKEPGDEKEKKLLEQIGKARFSWLARGR